MLHVSLMCVLDTTGVVDCVIQAELVGLGAIVLVVMLQCRTQLCTSSRMAMLAIL